MNRGRVFFIVAWLTGCSFSYGGGCGSPAPGAWCNPRSDQADQCPEGYYCPLAEVCTKACSTADDCVVPCTDGHCSCYPLFPETGPECAVKRTASCIDGYCQNCSPDAGCDYDIYGRSGR